jgi:hypothetical protein
MLRYLTYTFPAGNTSDVCKTQNTAGAGNLILNGNLANSIGSEVNFLSQGYSRSLSIDSANDLSGVTFTIKGTQNGELITVETAGPNATTKYVDDVFDVVTSISVSAVANDIRIGTGAKGYFPVIYINLQRAVINYSLSTYRLTAASIPTQILNSLDNFAQNGKRFSTALSVNAFEVKASSTDNQYILPPANVIPCHSIIIKIDGTDATIDNSIRMNFIQV